MNKQISESIYDEEFNNYHHKRIYLPLYAFIHEC